MIGLIVKLPYLADRKIIYARLNHRVLLTLEDFLGEHHHPLLCMQGKPLHGYEPVFLEVRLALQSFQEHIGE